MVERGMNQPPRLPAGTGPTALLSRNMPVTIHRIAVIASAAGVIFASASAGSQTPKESGAFAPRVSIARPLPHAISDSDEIALGAALLVQFDADRGVIATPQSRRIESYLQHVADSLGRFTQRKLPWHVHYDSHPGIKSGFALPGGHIVIWGGVLAYMSFEDELAAILAHEIEHTDQGQVARRIDSLAAGKHRDVKSAQQWNWREFGATYGEAPEKVCDFEGAKLMVKAGYSPLGMKMLLQSYLALAQVHAPSAPPPAAIVDRVAQIDHEIASEHWESLTTTHPLRLPP
jgi:predicted Zn-dependent protease